MFNYLTVYIVLGMLCDVRTDHYSLYTLSKDVFLFIYFHFEQLIFWTHKINYNQYIFTI